jgi:hypothetical protein
MSQPNLPAYVDLDGGIVIRPPYQQTRTSLSAWLIASDKAAQQRLLDAAFNRPSGGAVDYRALTSHAILSFADIGKLASLDARDSQHGHTEEIDTVVWLAVGAYEGGVLDRVLFYCPYIWVTNSYAMVAGRDVYGFPKALGWAKPPASPDDPGPLWAETLVLPHYAPSTDLSRQRIFTLSRPPGAGGGLSFGPGDGLLAVTTLIGKLVALGVEIEGALLAQLFGDLFAVKVPLVFLKQFRDAATSDRACYQSIVEANATVTSLRGMGLLPPGWTLDLRQYDSLRLIDTLGLGSAQTLDLGFWVDFDFSLDLGREVWRAT